MNSRGMWGWFINERIPLFTKRGMEKEIKREKRWKEKGEIQEKKKGKGNKSENQNGQERMDEEKENCASTR